jgi:hypothetical protein
VKELDIRKKISIPKLALMKGKELGRDALLKFGARVSIEPELPALSERSSMPMRYFVVAPTPLGAWQPEHSITVKLIEEEELMLL